MRSSGAPELEGRFGPDGRWLVPPRPWTGPGGGLEGPELRGALRAALRRLPERQRMVVALRDVAGFGSGDVQRLLAVSAATERMLLHRGRTALRLALEELLDPVAQPA